MNIRDRRCQEIRPDSLSVAGILLMFGWFASPYNSLDTFFTHTLERFGLYVFWSMLFLTTGTLKLASAWWRSNCPLWISFCANWLTTVSCLWTALLFTQVGPFTPTTAACWVIGVCGFISLYRNARQKQRMRESYGNRAESAGV